MTHTFTIPGYLIPSLNDLLRGGHFAGWRKKKECSELVTVYAKQAGIPPAKWGRRVSLLLILGPRNKRRDKDNMFKVVLDALKNCKLLVDDSEGWVELGTVAYAEGKVRSTIITLEDLDPLTERVTEES